MESIVDAVESPLGDAPVDVVEGGLDDADEPAGRWRAATSSTQAGALNESNAVSTDHSLFDGSLKSAIEPSLGSPY